MNTAFKAEHHAMSRPYYTLVFKCFLLLERKVIFYLPVILMHDISCSLRFFLNPRTKYVKTKNHFNYLLSYNLGKIIVS